jgi:hypothetical protein
MGVRLIVEALDHYHGEAHRKLWLVAFAEQANDKTRQGWPPRDLLARRADTSPSRASHIATELIGEGVLRRDGGGNRSGPAKYTMLPLAPPAAEGKGALRVHLKGAVNGAPSAHSSDEGKRAPSAHPNPQIKGAWDGIKGARSPSLPAETGSLPLKSIPLINTSPSRKREEYDDPAFAEFYEAYPRKEGKRAAWKAWLAATGRGADPVKIIKAALRFAEQRDGQDAKFTPHPATWLNHARYDDEAAAAQPAERDDDSWMR